MSLPPLNRFERRKQRTRALLMQTTVELILQQGYDAVTVQDITERADLGRGTFYVHFKNKEDLVWRLLQENVDAMRQEIEGQLANKDGDERLYLLWLATFQFVADHRALLQVAVGRYSNTTLAYHIQDYLAAIVQAELERGLRDPHLDLPNDIPPPVTAQFVTGAMIRTIAWWLEQGEESYSPTPLSRMFFYLVLHRPAPELA